MADTAGHPESAIMKELLDHGHEFAFSEVMRLARAHLCAAGAERLPEIPWHERVRVRPDLSLAFPASEVARVESSLGDRGDLSVTTAFLGLYGVSSPLPTHYSEELIEEAAADSSIVRDFLDILHQRLYQLYCECWNKYRLFLKVTEENDPSAVERLFCLIGLGEKAQRDSVIDPRSLIRYAGLFNQFPRSATSLQILLRDALGVPDLTVEQCVLRTVQITEDQRTRLGCAGNRLGGDTILGSEMADRMGKIRIRIGPLSRKDFREFLPGTPLHDRLAELIRLYLLDPFECDLHLTMAEGEARPIGLGDPDGSRLGFDSWCFSGDALGEVSATFPIVHSRKPTTVPADGEGSCSTPEGNGQATLVDHFREELRRLRELAAGYATAHPEMASIVTGHPADPSVERLFEGVAFLNARLRQKLDDDWPEVIGDLIAAVEPNAKRPIPATTVMVFSPKANCRGRQLVPAGSELESVPVEGTACRFTTCYPVEIHPLILTGASLTNHPGFPSTITVSLKLTGVCLADWNLETLRLFLSGDYYQASVLYLVLTRFLKRIVIAPAGNGEPVVLDASFLTPAGWGECEALFPTGESGAGGHDMMREFFILPEKFLFLDLGGWEKWRGRGGGSEFEIRFELEKLPFAPPKVTREDFSLFATPAINVFAHRSEPITMGRQGLRREVRPHVDGFLIYSIVDVVGTARLTNLKIPFVASRPGDPDSRNLSTYHVTTDTTSPHDRLHLTLSSPPGSPELASVSVGLQCTNGKLAERLRLGDICRHTDSSPIHADFANCKLVTRSGVQAREYNILWKKFATHAMNLSLLNAKLLRAALGSLLGSSFDRYLGKSDRRECIKGIADVQVSAVDRLVGRSMTRGWEIWIKLSREPFLSHGDLHLFGAVLERFLSNFASETSFTMTVIEDEEGARYRWPVRAGRRPVV